MQWVKGSGIAAALAQVIAMARIQFLAWGLPYAPDTAIKLRQKTLFALKALSWSNMTVPPLNPNYRSGTPCSVSLGFALPSLR